MIRDEAVICHAERREFLRSAAELQALNRCDGCRTVIHVLLIEHAGARICTVIFQRCEVRALIAPPIFGRSQ